MVDEQNALVPEDDDMLVFAAEEPEETPDAVSKRQWTVLIADDEIEVHNITQMVLSDYVFKGRSIRFLSAFTGEEAKKIMSTEPDIAIVLLDVVMESDDAGLMVVKFIREQLKNKSVRIILRTGQPGKAPEKEIITDYDINDYKAKTELTSQKLFTTITASLRSYNDLKTIEKNKMGLELILKSSARLFEYRSLNRFAAGVLTQLLALLRLDDHALYIRESMFAAANTKSELSVLAGTGEYQECVSKPIYSVLPQKVLAHLRRAMDAKSDLFVEDCYIGYFISKNGTQNLIYLTGCDILGDVDRQLVRIFAANVAVAFDNIYLTRDLVSSQKEMIYRLGEVVETRSKDTANHVQRVARMAHELALLAGLEPKQAELLREASPLHDIGKIGIPDAILGKPAKLTVDEFELVKGHTTIGYDILKKSGKKIIEAAAIIAWQHHEKWDGTGYPMGKKGSEIHIFARIVALTDVFDALTHERVYKEAWTVPETVNYIKSERGKMFDPGLVDVFIENLERFIEIMSEMPDDNNLEDWDTV